MTCVIEKLDFRLYFLYVTVSLNSHMCLVVSTRYSTDVDYFHHHQKFYWMHGSGWPPAVPLLTGQQRHWLTFCSSPTSSAFSLRISSQNVLSSWALLTVGSSHDSLVSTSMLLPQKDLLFPAKCKSPYCVIFTALRAGDSIF